MTSRDGNAWITFNGGICNFVEALRGMFGSALWNPARRRLVLVRDRVGI